MDPLAGWLVAVTADRRAAEQADLLQRRGAGVVLVPLVLARHADEDGLRAPTESLIADPPDVFVASTAIGVRAWIARAWSWGLGEQVLAALRSTTLVARGAKAASALASEGLDVAWRAPTETLAEVRDHLLDRWIPGRVVIQRDGRTAAAVAADLRAAGATVTELAVYDVAPVGDGSQVRRLARALEAGEVDAVTFTSVAAVEALVHHGLASAVHRTAPVCACVGPVTGATARAAGLATVVEAAPSRLGPMIRTLADALGARGSTVELAGWPVRVQGSRLAIGDREERLTPRERTLLDVLLDAQGAVVSKHALAAKAWSGEVDQHTVEVTINRVRRKLGAAATALETTNRRGYRLVAASQPPDAGCAAAVVGGS